MQTMWVSTRRKAKEQEVPQKLDSTAIGLTCGALWGLGLFSLTWWIIALDGPSEKPTAIGKLYRGYTISPRGSVIGLVWGFFDALAGGLLFAWMYNWLVRRRES